jgi:hypothetical protein
MKRFSTYFKALRNLFYDDEDLDYSAVDCEISRMTKVGREAYVRELEFNLKALDNLEKDFSARSNYVLVLNGVMLYATFALLLNADISISNSVKSFLISMPFFISILFTIMSAFNVLFCVIFPGFFIRNNGKQTPITIYDVHPDFFKRSTNDHILYDEVNTKYYFYLRDMEVLNRKSIILSVAGMLSLFSLVLMFFAAIGTLFG